MESVPQVDTCCCGLFPLKTGCYIIGVVSFIVELVAHGHSSQNAANQSLFGFIFIALIVCGIISSLLLIWGVYSGNRTLVQIYLIVFGALLIITLILLIIIILKESKAINYIIDNVVYWIVIGYCWIVVNSYYKSG